MACLKARRRCWRKIKFLFSIRFYLSVFNNGCHHTLGLFSRKSTIMSFVLLEITVAIGTAVFYIMQPEVVFLGVGHKGLTGYMIISGLRACQGFIGASGAWKRKVKTMRLYCFLLPPSILYSLYLAIPIFRMTCDCTDFDQCEILSGFWKGKVANIFPNPDHVPFAPPPGKVEKVDEVCTTLEGNACVFPFYYQGKKYSSCTEANYNRFWCATQVDDSGFFIAGSGKWGICSGNCNKAESSRRLPGISSALPVQASDAQLFRRRLAEDEAQSPWAEHLDDDSVSRREPVPERSLTEQYWHTGPDGVGRRFRERTKVTTLFGNDETVADMLDRKCVCEGDIGNPDGRSRSCQLWDEHRMVRTRDFSSSDLGLKTWCYVRRLSEKACSFYPELTTWTDPHRLAIQEEEESSEDNPETEETATVTKRESSAMWTEDICRFASCDCTEIPMAPPADISIRPDASEHTYGKSCEFWHTDDIRPWCFVGYDTVCSDRRLYYANPEVYDDPVDQIEKLSQYKSSIPCNVAFRKKATKWCHFFKYTMVFCMSLITVCSIGMVPVVCMFVQNRCGDTIVMVKQFDVDFSSDDDSDDDFDIDEPVEGAPSFQPDNSVSFDQSRPARPPSKKGRRSQDGTSSRDFDGYSRETRGRGEQDHHRSQSGIEMSSMAAPQNLDPYESDERFSIEGAGDRQELRHTT